MRYLKGFPSLALATVLFSVIGAAQDKSESTTPRSSCSRDSALTIIQRQVDLSKTIDSDAQRIALLIRAADLSWPLEQDAARAIFTDAFDIASRLFKEKTHNNAKVVRALRSLRTRTSALPARSCVSRKLLLPQSIRVDRV
jgi:hypothetical protein